MKTALKGIKEIQKTIQTLGLHNGKVGLSDPISICKLYNIEKVKLMEA